MNAADDESRERGQAVALAGTPHGRALAGQGVQIVKDSDGFRVFAPVTSRGEAVGVLELGLRPSLTGRRSQSCRLGPTPLPTS